jgi:hypothetical protein
MTESIVVKKAFKLCLKKLNHFEFTPVLPYGLFSNPKYKFGYILEGLGIHGRYWYFYDHLEYFTTIWYILWQFGIVYGNLVHFSRFGMFGPGEIWQPWFTPLVQLIQTDRHIFSGEPML